MAISFPIVSQARGSALPCATATRTGWGMGAVRTPGFTGWLRSRPHGAGTSWCSCGNAIDRRPDRVVRGLPRRSRGSRTGPPGCSCQVLFGGPRGPGGEALAGLAAGLVPAQHPLDVAGQVLGGGLEAAQLAAEPGPGAVAAGQRAAQVDLEPLDRGAV